MLLLAGMLAVSLTVTPLSCAGDEQTGGERSTGKNGGNKKAPQITKGIPAAARYCLPVIVLLAAGGSLVSLGTAAATGIIGYNTRNVIAFKQNALYLSIAGGVFSLGTLF